MAAFPASIRWIDEDRRFLVTFRDLPDAITGGDSEPEARAMAEDALSVTIAGRIEAGEPLPEPSLPEPGEVLIHVGPTLAGKAELYRAAMAAGLAGLAERLHRSPDEVRRLLDPETPTTMDDLDRALRLFGRRLIVLSDAA